MSDFKTALKIALSHEGGYANVAGDTGGETYQGISRNNWPAGRIGWIHFDTGSPNSISPDHYTFRSLI